MEEEMMVSPAFIKKTAGVRGEEDEETGKFFRVKKPSKISWRKNIYKFCFWKKKIEKNCFRKPNIFVLQQCSVQWIRREGARV